MKSYRLGNDINFAWTVRGLDEVSGEKAVKLYHVNRSVPELITYTISGNVVYGVYRGKNQTEKGAYRLLLQVNNGDNNMVTLDKVNAWALFGVCSFGIVAGEDDDAIQTASVELESDLRTGTSPGSNVQSDWNETDPDSPGFIKHKPTIPDVSGKAEKSEMNVEEGSGDNADKTTITLKSGMAATVLNTHQKLYNGHSASPSTSLYVPVVNNSGNVQPSPTIVEFASLLGVQRYTFTPQNGQGDSTTISVYAGLLYIYDQANGNGYLYLIYNGYITEVSKGSFTVQLSVQRQDATHVVITRTSTSKNTIYILYIRYV